MYNVHCMYDIQRSHTEDEQQSMQAYATDRYGGPEVLRLSEIARPKPAQDQVLIRVRATSVNPLDWHELRGEPWLMRMGKGLRRPNDGRRGNDLAGLVVAVGDGVTEITPGTEVIGTGIGAFAEYAVARPTSLAAAPTTIDPAEAAALPIAGITALQAVRAARIETGARVLIIGASGGVGTCAVQIAAASGGIVTGVCSTSNLDLVRSLGASEVLDYTTTQLDGLTDRFDACIDCVGNLPVKRCKRLLVKGGRYIAIGAPDGTKLLGPLTRLVHAKLAFSIGGRRGTVLFASIGHNDLSELVSMVDRGVLRPVIDRVVPFAALADGIRHVETKRTRGKVVVQVASFEG